MLCLFLYAPGTERRYQQQAPLSIKSPPWRSVAPADIACPSHAAGSTKAEAAVFPQPLPQKPPAFQRAICPAGAAMKLTLDRCCQRKSFFAPPKAIDTPFPFMIERNHPFPRICPHFLRGGIPKSRFFFRHLLPIPVQIGPFPHRFIFPLHKATEECRRNRRSGGSRERPVLPPPSSPACRSGSTRELRCLSTG